MKLMLGVCLIGASLAGMVGAQDLTKPVLRRGISVQMPAASEAVAMPAADEEGAIVVTVTAEGKLFVGMHLTEVNALTSLKAPKVYVKADAKAPFQQVLTVLDALDGDSVVLLTAPTVKGAPGKLATPYGVPVALGGQRLGLTSCRVPNAKGPAFPRGLCLSRSFDSGLRPRSG